MKRNKYYPSRQADQTLWLANFASKLTPYTGTLGILPAQVTSIIADCNWLIYVLELWLPAARAWSLATTNALKEAESGPGSLAQSLPPFIAPALPAGTVAVNPGALDRIFDLVQVIKESGKLTDTISANLGLVGSAQTGPDLATVQPALAANVVGSQVLVKWGWGGHGAFLDSCEIHVDRADSKGFVLLTIDTTPNYTDTQPFPAGQSALWKYKAIYRQGDQRVGQWSEVVTVAVAG